MSVYTCVQKEIMRLSALVCVSEITRLSILMCDSEIRYLSILVCDNKIMGRSIVIRVHNEIMRLSVLGCTI